jgi:hypothetical protein
MRRRAMQVLVAMAASLIVGSAIALAETIGCTTNLCLARQKPRIIFSFSSDSYYEE